MTRAVITGTKSTAVALDGRASWNPGGGAAPVVAATTTAVASDVATLVADGADPTQAHVNTLNTDWGTLLTQLDALSAETGDFYFSFTTTKIVTLNDLNTALDSIKRQALASGLV